MLSFYFCAICLFNCKQDKKNTFFSFLYKFLNPSAYCERRL